MCHLLFAWFLPLSFSINVSIVPAVSLASIEKQLGKKQSRMSWKLARNDFHARRASTTGSWDLFSRDRGGPQLTLGCGTENPRFLVMNLFELFGLHPGYSVYLVAVLNVLQRVVDKILLISIGFTTRYVVLFLFSKCNQNC